MRKEVTGPWDDAKATVPVAVVERELERREDGN